MTSIDARIKREVRRSGEVRRQQDKHDLERLREYVYDDVMNMKARVDDRVGPDPDRTGKAALWLHGHTYDDTYPSFGQNTKRVKIRERIELLLELCGGDRELLLREYRAALAKYFPLETITRYFEWNPILINKRLPSGRQRVSLKYARRRKKV